MPRTVNGLWDELTSFENLHLAYMGARDGKRYRNEVMQFAVEAEEHLFNIQNHML